MSRFIYFIAFIFFSFSCVAAIENTPKRKLRFFCLDIHGAVSADIKDIFEKLGHEVVVWVVTSGPVGYSRFTHGRENDPVEVFNFHSWFNCEMQMYEDFYERYKDYLSQFDGYIAAFNSTFALLYKNLNKPIIIINAVRYEFPLTGRPELWESLNHFLIDGVKSGRLFMVSNNKGDREYLKYYTGLDSELIPSLCLYTQAKYSGNKEFFVCQPTTRGSELPNFTAQKYSNLIDNNLPRPYQWQDLYDYKGIIHFPYQISTMSIFEEYSANVPLFFPSKKFLVKLRQQDPSLLQECSCGLLLVYPSIVLPTTPGDLNNLSDPKVMKFWIDHADFYDRENMPYIQYFDSFKHLNYLLKMFNLNIVSQNMKNHNKKRKVLVFRKWKSLLEKVSEAIDKKS